MSFDKSDSVFYSYLDYVRALCRQNPQYRDLKSGLELSKNSQLGRIQLQDIRNDGTYADARIFTFNEANAATNLRDALSECPSDVRTRIVLIEYRSSQRFDPFYGAEEEIPLSSGLWCEVGLKLDIEPLFFEASWNKGKILRMRRYPHKPQDFLRMIYMTLKVLRCPDVKNGVPTAVVAFNSSRKVEGSQVLYMLSQPPSLEQFRPDNDSKLESHSIETTDFVERGKPYGGKDAGDVFLSLLRTEQTNSSDDDLFRCLAVMSRIESTFFRASMSKFFDLWEILTAQPSEKMAIKFRATWRPCRRRLDNYKEAMRAFPVFSRRYFGQAVYQDRLAELHDEQSSACESGQEIEAIWRDDLRHSVGNVQVEVSQAVLDESRRSIVEGKRVQLITILAFVFIPLSLAASIFGMNVQEINRTGPSIWEFVVTSVVLVLLALGGWFVSHRVLHRRRKSVLASK